MKNANRILCVFILTVLCLALMIPATSAPDIWDGLIATSFAGGDGTKESPYLISRGSHLAYLAEQVNDGERFEGKFFKLTQDIHLNDTTNVTKWDTVVPANVWTPIGNSSSNGYFAGSFDGDNHTIYGVYVSRTSNYTGLFGVVNGTVKNLHIRDSYFSGKKYVGSISGLVTGGNIYNCSSNAVIISNNNSVGGLTGRLNNSVMEKCYFYGSVEATGSDASGLGRYIGGLTGTVGAGGVVRKSYNTGKVTALDGNLVGGIAGLLGSDSGTGSVIDCYNTGEITALKNAGGITGRAGNTVGGEVKNCYNTGLVKVETIGGGVIGDVRSFTLLSNCYFSNTSCDFGIGANNSLITVEESEIKSIKYEDMVGNNAVATMKLSEDIWLAQSDGTPVLVAFQPGYVDIDPDETTTAPETTVPADTTASDTNAQETTRPATTTAKITTNTGTTSAGEDKADEGSFSWIIALIVLVALLAVGVTIYIIRRQRKTK